jgi:adenylosuccinate lyase
MATEIRNLSRQEVHEVEEGFTKGQKGSSAMPHKRNPIGSENICGCARVIKAYVNTALDNNVLWHERDISHSSAERIILADSTTLLDYMLNRFNNILTNLVVYPERMIENIHLTNDCVFSGAVLNKLVSKGWIREEAYDKIQPLAFKALETKTSFEDLIRQENWLTKEEIDEVFNLQNYLKNVDAIYKSVGIE